MYVSLNVLIAAAAVVDVHVAVKIDDDVVVVGGDVDDDDADDVDDANVNDVIVDDADDDVNQVKLNQYPKFHLLSMLPLVLSMTKMQMLLMPIKM